MDKVPNTPKNLLSQFSAYSLVSGAMYLFIFVGMYVLTGLLQVSAPVAYFVLMSLNYVMVYFLNTSYVFKQKSSQANAALFVVHVVVFWALNNVVYASLYAITTINYLVLVAVNIALFTPLRFLSLKHFVFRSERT